MTNKYFYDDSNQSWNCLRYKKKDYSIVRCLDDGKSFFTVMDEDDFVVIQNMNVPLIMINGFVGFTDPTTRKVSLLHQFIAKKSKHSNGIVMDNRRENLLTSHGTALTDDYYKLVKASGIRGCTNVKPIKKKTAEDNSDEEDEDTFEEPEEVLKVNLGDDPDDDSFIPKEILEKIIKDKNNISFLAPTKQDTDELWGFM